MVLHGENQYYYSAAEEFGQLVDGIVCVSESIRRNIPQRFQAKTITIGPSILLTKGHRAQSRKPHEVDLIFVAREDLNKGVQHLSSIDLSLHEHKLRPNWTIVLGSRPEEVCSFRAWVSENPDRVNVLENIENQKVPKLINEHDALILPSRTEGHPMVLIEALSQGVPPFSFYYSSQCENHLPVDHENIVGPSRNLEELANRLVLHHQRTKESNEKWKSSATDFVQRYHNPSIQAQNLGDFLDSLPRKQKTPLRQKFYKWKRRALILLKSW